MYHLLICYSLTLKLKLKLVHFLAMTIDEFSRSVDTGLKLSKRIYYGKDTTSTSAPKQRPSMEKSLSRNSSSASSFKLPQNHHPTGPMVYAVINEPNVVDNPDIKSYQPYVYGRCDPPALIPLHMVGVNLEVVCCLDTAVVTLSASWRVHCVASNVCCDCRVAIPMGEQGSLLGVEVETTTRSYFTQLVTSADEKDDGQQTTKKDGFLMKGNTYTFQILQVEGGSNIHVMFKWSQKLLYQGDGFCLCVPFTFPVHVFPVFKKVPCREKIVLNVNSGIGVATTCNIASHPLKELKRQGGQLCFSYEAEVVKWSCQDFYFSYSVCSKEIYGRLLLQSPSLHDYDQRDMFCFYLFPGIIRNMKPFRKEVVFVIDISGSMRGDPLEKTKYEVIGSLWKLNQADSFNILASNGDIKSFSSSLVLATEETITNATEWMNTSLIADGGTNLMVPLKQAIDQVSKTGDSIPLIFLITDGTVEDERDICNMMKVHIVDGNTNSPRICTFGIGSYCNHYFLQMLANIGKGYYDSALDVDSISIRMQKLLDNATTPILSNVKLDALQNLDSYEIYPFHLPDLLSRSPLIVSGRFKGKFPDVVKVQGFLADLSTHVIDVKVMKATDMPLEMVCARREIDLLTAHAWLDQNKELEEKVAKMSLQRGVPCEYTRMILALHDNVKPTIESLLQLEKYSKSKNKKKTYFVNLSIGFGNLTATAENLPPGIQELKLSEQGGKMMKAAASFCAILLDRFCCKCFIQASVQVNDQCAIALTQLCAALACFQCLSCCCDTCDSCAEMCLNCL